MWVCRLPVHIDPAERAVLYGNLRRIRNCPMGRQSRRPLQQVSALPVGADDSVRPQNAVVFSEIYGEFVTSQRADVGIGPYNSLSSPCRGGRPCPPAEYAGFMEICGEFVSSQRTMWAVKPLQRTVRTRRLPRQL